MGRSKKGILGGFTGTIGTVVGTKWRGEYIMRSLPDRGEYDASPSQLEQQAKFTLVMQFLTKMKSVVGKYFGKGRGTKSIMNLATSYHLKYAINMVAGQPVMDYPRVIISKGDLQGMMDGVMTPKPDQVMSISWLNNSAMGYANANDQLLLVIYVEALNITLPLVGVATRADQQYDVQLPAYLSGIEIQAWAGFATADGVDAATSMYLGAEVVS